MKLQHADSCVAPNAASVMMLRNLDRLARAHGGAVYMLNGNHESLNIAGDFRCGSNAAKDVLMHVLGPGALPGCSAPQTLP